MTWCHGTRPDRLAGEVAHQFHILNSRLFFLALWPYNSGTGYDLQSVTSLAGHQTEDHGHGRASHRVTNVRGHPEVVRPMLPKQVGERERFAALHCAVVS